MPGATRQISPPAWSLKPMRKNTGPKSWIQIEPEGGAKMNSTIANCPNHLTREEIRNRVEQLGKWFHNLDLNGVLTAPDHFLGDYPRLKWQSFAHVIPADLS